MSDLSLSLSPVALRRIEKMCDRFEADLREGRRPALEAYLGDEEEPTRSALRQELAAPQEIYERRTAEGVAATTISSSRAT